MAFETHVRTGSATYIGSWCFFHGEALCKDVWATWLQGLPGNLKMPIYEYGDIPSKNDT